MIKTTPPRKFFIATFPQTAALFLCLLAFNFSAFAASPDGEMSDTDLINAVRAFKVPDVNTRAELVKMFIEVKNGKSSYALIPRFGIGRIRSKSNPGL